MLFYLTDSLIVNKEDPHYFTIKKCIRNLALSVVESKHLLSGSYPVIEFFEQMFSPNNDEISILFQKMKQDFVLWGIPSCLSYYVEVVNADPLGIRTVGHCSVGQVSFERFSDTYSCQSCGLVGEDRRDTKFYDYITKWYLKEWKKSNLKYNFDGLRGGGDNTEDEIRTQQKKGRVCIGIVDTDKKYPTDNIKPESTCGKCLRIGNSELCKIIVLNVHEIENIIPLNFINLLEWEDGAKVNKLHFDELCYRAKSEYILPFFDFKKGIHKKDILDNPVYFSFAKECYVQNHYINQSFDFESYVSNLNDGDWVYRPLKSALLKPICEVILKRNDLVPELMEFQQTEWLKIGENIVNFACARTREAIH